MMTQLYESARTLTERRKRKTAQEEEARNSCCFPSTHTHALLSTDIEVIQN